MGYDRIYNLDGNGGGWAFHFSETEGGWLVEYDEGGAKNKMTKTDKTGFCE